MRIAGYSSVTVSQQYVHPSPESLERAFERLDAMNSSARGESEPGTKSGTEQKARIVEIASESNELTRWARSSTGRATDS